MNGASHEITYHSLFRGPSLCFPCDERGEVSLDSLSELAGGRPHLIRTRTCLQRERIDLAGTCPSPSAF